MSLNIRGTVDQDGGSSTQPLSTQRRNCRPTCRRPFPACSTALCVWLLAVEAAAARSARVPPCTRCSRIPPGALPSSLHACCQCLGLAHDHAHSCPCGCTRRDATMQPHAQERACSCASPRHWQRAWRDKEEHPGGHESRARAAGRK